MGTQIDRLRTLLEEVFDLRASAAVLEWDQQVNMPSGGAPGRAMQLSLLSRLAHERFIADEIGEDTIVMKDNKGRIIGIEKLNYDVPYTKSTKLPVEILSV